MTSTRGILSILMFFVYLSIIGQDQLELTKKDSTVVSPWLFGVGYNFIDDSGDVFDAVLDIDKSWHALSYPSRISVGKYLENGLGFEVIGAYMKYKKGKKVDGQILSNDMDFWSVDARLSYDLNNVFGETGWFDPYVGVGVGYTDANNLTRSTFNGTVGFRAWFSDNLGLDVNSSGKWSMEGTATNYLQHAIGVVYRFSKKKKLTKAGEEKLGLIKELQQEEKRVNDSIQLVKEKEAEKLLIVKEAEENMLQEKKDKEEAQKRKLEVIKSDVQALEQLYFEFDAANLTSYSKNTLSKLVDIMNKNPEITVEITSHTDSRGSAAYNKTLSVKRFKSTINYLLSRNINPDRIFGNGYGEERLSNECNDNTYCSEKKHRANRRSEIKVLID